MNHDLVTVGVPLLAILAGIFLNNQQLSGFERRVEQRFDQVNTRLDLIDQRVLAIERDMARFYGVTGKIEGRIDELSARVK